MTEQRYDTDLVIDGMNGAIDVNLRLLLVQLFHHGIIAPDDSDRAQEFVESLIQQRRNKAPETMASLGIET